MPSRKRDHRAEISRKIKTWLKEENRQFTSVDDEKAFENLLLDVRDFKVNLLIRRDKPDSVIIAATIGLTPEDQRAFSYLKPEKRIEFQQNCELTLLHIGADYTFLPDTDNAQSVSLVEVIYYDGFTKHNFFASIKRISHALELVNLQYSRLKASVLNP